MKTKFDIYFEDQLTLAQKFKIRTWLAEKNPHTVHKLLCFLFS